MPVIYLKPTLRQRVREFIETYRIYRQVHGRRYSFRIAYGCAFLGLPF